VGRAASKFIGVVCLVGAVLTLMNRAAASYDGPCPTIFQQGIHPTGPSGCDLTTTMSAANAAVLAIVGLTALLIGWRAPQWIGATRWVTALAAALETGAFVVLHWVVALADPEDLLRPMWEHARTETGVIAVLLVGAAVALAVAGLRDRRDAPPAALVHR
jgi:hypothetical protein